MTLSNQQDTDNRASVEAQNNQTSGTKWDHAIEPISVASGCGYYRCSCGWRSQVSCDGDQDPNKAYDQQVDHLREAEKQRAELAA